MTDSRLENEVLPCPCMALRFEVLLKSLSELCRSALATSACTAKVGQWWDDRSSSSDFSGPALRQAVLNKRVYRRESHEQQFRAAMAHDEVDSFVGCRYRCSIVCSSAPSADSVSNKFAKQQQPKLGGLRHPLHVQ